ncbi:DUF4258 domain-containing protein [bacterium]|nr:DUF4258 domain-containing protein [bacterium]
MTYRLSRHAQQECERRRIPLSVVDAVVSEPQQVVPERDGKRAYQSRVTLDDGRTFLVRAIVDDSERPATVITVYRTTKIEKYWRTP